jgi:hypothetical protein
MTKRKKRIMQDNEAPIQRRDGFLFRLVPAAWKSK